MSGCSSSNKVIFPRKKLSEVEERVRKKLREKNIDQQHACESDNDEVELEEGVTVIFWGASKEHRVELHPGDIAVKRARGMYLGEVAALHVAELAGLPVPHVHGSGESNGLKYIQMDFIAGQTLEQLWKNMTTEHKRDIAKQLRNILTKMRSIPPPFQVIGSCDGKGIRDSRAYHTYDAPLCHDEHAFNEYLISGLTPKTPPAVRDAFLEKLRTNHRIVLSHCDLAPRNIIVRDGQIVALIGWADAG